MRGIRFAWRQSVYIERNRYAPWGRGVVTATRPARAPYVWRKGNGRLDVRADA